MTGSGRYCEAPGGIGGAKMVWKKLVVGGGTMYWSHWYEAYCRSSHWGHWGRKVHGAKIELKSCANTWVYEKLCAPAITCTGMGLT